jgi:hypothetical protein
MSNEVTSGNSVQKRNKKSSSFFEKKNQETFIFWDALRASQPVGRAPARQRKQSVRALAC